ncbi:MAG: DUF362 domain-containing protein, partial [Verrucomicrobiota bacterium]
CPSCNTLFHKNSVTLGLKNFVGTVGRKQCLAHHRDGGIAAGGDEYPDSSLLKRICVRLEGMTNGNRSELARRILGFGLRVDHRLMKMLRVNPVFDGEWHGNDTCWRMVHDLVRIVRYGTREGRLANRPQRPILTIVDGIVAGEGNGPLQADARTDGCVIVGVNPVLTDIVTATLMGFDHEKIALLREAGRIETWPLCQTPAHEARLMVDDRTLTFDELSEAELLRPFRAPDGWLNHMERDARPVC